MQNGHTGMVEAEKMNALTSEEMRRLFGKRTPIGFSVVGQEELVKEIIDGLLNPDENEYEAEWVFHEGLYNLTGICYWNMSTADMLALREIAMSTKSVGLLLITATLLEEELVVARDDYQNTNDLAKVIYLHQKITEAIVAADDAIEKAPGFDVEHPMLAKLEALRGEMNSIARRIHNIRSDRALIEWHHTNNKAIDVALAETINDLTEEANRLKAQNDAQIAVGEKYIAAVMHGDKCPCAVCRESELRRLIDDQATKSMGEMLTSQGYGSRSHSCGCGSDRDPYADMDMFGMGPGDDSGCGNYNDLMEELEEELSHAGNPMEAAILIEAMRDAPDDVKETMLEIIRNPEMTRLFVEKMNARFGGKRGLGSELMDAIMNGSRRHSGSIGEMPGVIEVGSLEEAGEVLKDLMGFNLFKR